MSIESETSKAIMMSMPLAVRLWYSLRQTGRAMVTMASDEREEGERQAEAAGGAADALAEADEHAIDWETSPRHPAPRPRRRTSSSERGQQQQQPAGLGEAEMFEKLRSCGESVVQGFQQGAGIRDDFAAGPRRGFPGAYFSAARRVKPVSAAARASALRALQRIVAGDEFLVGLEQRGIRRRRLTDISAGSASDCTAALAGVVGE